MEQQEEGHKQHGKEHRMKTSENQGRMMGDQTSQWAGSDQEPSLWEKIG